MPDSRQFYTAATEAERRQVTVMFCDLVGFTELSSRLDPEDLREVVQLYQATITQVITQLYGYVAQYLGDGILVYFGYPRAEEDTAESAVRAGLNILQVLETLHTSSVSKIEARLGVATGIAVISDEFSVGSSHHVTATGQVTNLAARIQALAETGTILIADSTKSYSNITTWVLNYSRGWMTKCRSGG